MKGDIDLREINFRKLRPSRRALLILGAVALCVVGGMLAWRHINNPPRPWLVRWRLDRYLKKEAHTGNFKVDFAFPSKAEMAAPKTPGNDGAEPTKGSQTGKDFETLRDEYLALKLAAVQLEQTIVRGETEQRQQMARLATLTNQMPDPQPGSDAPSTIPNLQSNVSGLRDQIATTQKITARRPELESMEQKLAPLVDDLWEFQRTWVSQPAGLEGTSAELAKAHTEFTRTVEQKLADAPSYEAMYLAIGQELFVAKHLMESGNPAHRRMAVTTAFTAARHALNFAMNGNVAARICEGYILPNIDLATDANRRSAFHEENFLSQCADLFRRNNEFNNVVRTYEIYMARTKVPARADWARSQIAAAYEQGGNPRQAIVAIRQIQDTNTYSRLIRRIPRLQQDADMQR